MNNEEQNQNLQQSDKNVFKIVLYVCIVFLALLTGFYLYRNTDNNPDNSQSSYTQFKEISIAGQTIPRKDCGDVKPLIKNRDTRGELCYQKQINISGEDINVIAIKEEPKIDKCEPECNDVALHEAYFIVRSNGKIEDSPIHSPELARSFSNDISGCSPELTNSNTKQQIIKVKNQISIKTLIINGLHKDEYGNECKSNLELITASSEPFFTIKSTSVSYKLKDESNCDKLENSLNVPKCYARLALLKNDIGLCAKADEGPNESGNNNCIVGVAVRSLDPSLCSQLVEIKEEGIETNFQKDCVNRISNLKNDFKGKLVVK